MDALTVEGRSMLRLTGRLNGSTAERLDRYLTAAGPGPDWWDLSALDFISSAGLRVLIAHEKRRHRLGAPKSILAGLQPAVRQVLELTGLEAFWELLAAMPVSPSSRSMQAEPGDDDAPANKDCPGAWQPCASESCALVHWEAAAGEAASVASLPLAFGRAGLGLTRELAAQQPFGFATFGSTLALRRDDGECDALTVANPGTRFLRLQEAWLLGGEPQGRLQLSTDTPWQVWPGRLPAAIAGQWLGCLAVMPLAAGGSTVTVAVIAPAAGDGLRATVGVTLAVPALDFSAMADCRVADAAREMIAAAAESGPQPEPPDILPTGSVLWVWAVPTPTPALEYGLEVVADGADDATELLVRTLYPDCRRATLSRLSGGFSAATWLVESEDANGRRHLPTVLKVGPPGMMNRENAAHETCVRPFILNNASVALGHAAQGESVGLRYNFVGITGDGGNLQTLARRWQAGRQAEVTSLFGRLARETLRPWYGQSRRRAVRLYADHSPLRLFPGLIAAAEGLLGTTIAAPRLTSEVLERTLPNPWRFLAVRWSSLMSCEIDCPVSITHGDLNLNNVLADDAGNLHVIDFSETRERAVTSDFARNEPVFLLERTDLGTAEREAAFLRDADRLYGCQSAWHQVPTNLETVDSSRLAFLREGRRLAHEHLGATGPLQAWYLPLLEWTLPITLFGNLPEPNRRLATWVAALQLERLQLVAQEAAEDFP